jgi:hypothetical protein
MQTQEHGFRVIASTGDFPLLNRFVDSDMKSDLDELFEFGLGRLLDGLERYLAAAGGSGESQQTSPGSQPQ